MTRAVLGFMLLTACGTAAPVGTRAFAVHPTAETRAAVAQAVGKALSAQVPVDDENLATTGVVIVERAQIHRHEVMIEGRDPSEPGRTEQFHLVLRDERCFLVHERTNRYYALAGTTCAPR